MSIVFGSEYDIGTKRIIDLRSDVVTKPSKEMINEMFSAIIGNDGWGEDPTVNKLQDLFASMVGKERALFVPSGSMGNLLAVMSQTQRGDEIIADIDSHIFQYSVGAISVCAGVQIRPIALKTSFLTAEDIRDNIRVSGFQYPKTTMVCLENPHNIHGGQVHNVKDFDLVCDFAHSNRLQVHLDGSRLFNAAIAHNVSIQQWTRNVDTVMCCLSKSLGAPIGSLLAGRAEVIEKAIHYRRMLGGHMRQAGYLAAAGIYALKNNVNRLSRDHYLARKFSILLSKIPGIEVIKPETNMVFFKPDIEICQFIDNMAKSGILMSQYSQGTVRVVFHMDISEYDVEYVIAKIKLQYD